MHIFVETIKNNIMNLASIVITLTDKNELIIKNSETGEILMVRENVKHWDWFELWNDFNKYGKLKEEQ